MPAIAFTALSWLSGTVTARPSAFSNSYVTVPPGAMMRCLTAAYGFLALTMTRWSASADEVPPNQRARAKSAHTPRMDLMLRMRDLLDLVMWTIGVEIASLYHKTRARFVL